MVFGRVFFKVRRLLTKRKLFRGNTRMNYAKQLTSTSSMKVYLLLFMLFSFGLMIGYNLTFKDPVVAERKAEDVSYFLGWISKLQQSTTTGENITENGTTMTTRTLSSAGFFSGSGLSSFFSKLESFENYWTSTSSTGVSLNMDKLSSSSSGAYNRGGGGGGGSGSGEEAEGVGSNRNTNVVVEEEEVRVTPPPLVSRKHFDYILSELSSGEAKRNRTNSMKNMLQVQLYQYLYLYPSLVPKLKEFLPVNPFAGLPVWKGHLTPHDSYPHSSLFLGVRTRCGISRKLSCISRMEEYKQLQQDHFRKLSESNMTASEIQKVPLPNIFLTGSFPNHHPTTFEWLDILDSIHLANFHGSTYTLVEVGKCWAQRAVDVEYLIRWLYPEMKVRTVSVDANPKCLEKAEDHLSYNELDYIVLNATQDGTIYERDPASGPSKQRIAYFDNHAHYLIGTAMYYKAGTPIDFYSNLKLEVLELHINKNAADFREHEKLLSLYPISLPRLLIDLKKVDILILDIDKTLEFLLADIDTQKAIAANVRRIFLWTSTNLVESMAKNTMTRLGWVLLHNFAGRGPRNTVFGEIKFWDGVQSWLNPTYFIL